MWCVIIDEGLDNYVVGPFNTENEAKAYADERNSTLDCQADAYPMVHPTEKGGRND